MQSMLLRVFRPDFNCDDLTTAKELGNGYNPTEMDSNRDGTSNAQEVSKGANFFTNPYEYTPEHFSFAGLLLLLFDPESI